ncbi:hypothetical protein DFH08DRAFT_950162 [Mycena albidolilacea]|uniref:Uncharacterized protein n=1 Tax=Mycena albidolilacea TaxID=1033008 RepID=A0AAD7APH5_9AGAR|nr:hypothetical protein DFH08DRAFT_950162 [Mycena albidolilacea]
MQLPPEVRVGIYSHLFFSTRVTWAKNIVSSRRIAPAPNALALLRTCRRVHVEIGTTWLHQVLFNFGGPRAMLDKLTIIPNATRALIRHARVFGDPVKIYWNYGDVSFRTAQVLKLLPELALDRLTILGPQNPVGCYDTLDMLVRHGAGWKELYYLAHDSTFLAYEHDWFQDQRRYLRMPQPGCWQRAIEERDGATSGASVVIYRATSPHPCSVLLQPATRAPFAQTLPVGKHPKSFGMEADAALTMPGERDKEVLVVVTRGRGVDYAEKEDSPCLEEDMRVWMGGKTWSETRTEQNADLRGEEAVVDDYICVDDYRWPTSWRDPEWGG